MRNTRPAADIWKIPSCDSRMAPSSLRLACQVMRQCLKAITLLVGNERTDRGGEARSRVPLVPTVLGTDGRDTDLIRVRYAHSITAVGPTTVGHN
uniref:Uncharacterized protein n=1 Tax=Plectus sambesii TaxID=2011161 RepID=A0A914WL42_9BILA